MHNYCLLTIGLPVRLIECCFYSISTYANLYNFFTSKHTGIKSYFYRELKVIKNKKIKFI